MTLSNQAHSRPASRRASRFPWHDLTLVPVALTAIAADLLIRRGEWGLWTTTMWLVFGASALASLLLAFALVPWLRAVRAWRPTVALTTASIASVVWSWTVILSLGYFVQMGSLPVTSAVRYLLQEPKSTFSLIKPHLTEVAVLAPLILAPLFLATLWWWAAAPRVRPERKHPQPARFLSRSFVGRAAMVALAFAIIVGLSLKPPRYRFAVVDVHAMLLTSNMARLAANGHAQRLSKPHRIALGQLKPSKKRPNVLLIVNETYGSSALSLYGCKAPTTPRTDAFVRAHADTVTVFPHAQSNAGSTLVSLPSLFSGLAPTRTAIEFHTAPLLWNIAKAAGYRTFLHTAQDLNWLQLDIFLLDTGLDSAFHAGKSALPVVNDIGIADERMIDGAITHVEQLVGKGHQPFFGVIQFNATHSPHAWHPGHNHGFTKLAPDQKADHLDTVAFVDQLTGKLLDRLKKLGLLNNTVIALTADHGHNLVPARLPNRLHNYYESVHRVPFLLHLPSGTGPENAASTLRMNIRRRVSNLDVVPTLVDAMGAYGGLPDSVTSRFDGHSLLRPLPPARILPFVNNTEIRQASRRGFTLVVGDLKYLFFEIETGCEEHLYNWRTDPMEQHDLWPTTSPSERQVWHGRVRGYPLLHRARQLGSCQSSLPTL